MRASSLLAPGLLVAVLTVAALPAAAQIVTPSDMRPAGVPPIDRAVVISFGATTIPVVAGAALYFTSDSGTMQAAGVALASAGYVLGPALGMLYLQDPGSAWLGVALRGAGAAALTGGYVLGFVVAPDRDGVSMTMSSVLFSASAILIPFGLAHTFIHMPRAARDLHVQLAPRRDHYSGAVMPALVVRF